MEKKAKAPKWLKANLDTIESSTADKKKKQIRNLLKKQDKLTLKKRAKNLKYFDKECLKLPSKSYINQKHNLIAIRRSIISNNTESIFSTTISAIENIIDTNIKYKHDNKNNLTFRERALKFASNNNLKWFEQLQFEFVTEKYTKERRIMFHGLTGRKPKEEDTKRLLKLLFKIMEKTYK